MSDGMAFLTGAAFAGVAVLFLMRGGTNLSAANLPVAQTQPISPNTMTSPYPNGTLPQVQPTASPGSPLYNSDQQRLVGLIDQQRAEIEQLKAQLQSQQSLMQKLTTTPQNDPNANSLFAQAKPASVNPQTAQPDNPLLSGLVWALGGMAVTISGGVVVIGALSVLSRQQRSPRTTYVVQHPTYTALPPTLQTRRRAEYMPPQVVERQIDPIDYD